MTATEIALRRYRLIQSRRSGQPVAPTGYERNEKSPPASDRPDLISFNSFNSYAGPHGESQTTDPATDLISFNSFNSYRVVNQYTAIPGIVKAVAASTVVGLDIETTGLDPRRSAVRLLSLATASGTFVLDLYALPLDDLEPLFDALAAVEVCGHNLIFDLQFLRDWCFHAGRVFDTMLASQVLDAGVRSVRHSLSEVAQRYLGETVNKAEQLADWGGTLTAEMIKYAALDAELPVRIRAAMLPRLEAAKLTGTADLEFRALPALVVASRSGVAFDSDSWQALARSASDEAARLTEEMNKLVPGRKNLFDRDLWNWDSPAVVVQVFASLGVALTSSDDNALASVPHPLASLLRQYRAATKKTGTYGTDWIAKYVREDRIYPGWRQLGAASGRMSCSNPNLQQVPRGSAYRRCFVPARGRVFVKADYSQVELRIAAKIANEPRMIEAYRRGDDLHTLTAKSITGKSEVTKADRQLAKALNFGLLYGMGYRSLIAYAKSNYDVTLSESEAKSHHAAFFRSYPGLSKWHATVRVEVEGIFRKTPDAVHESRTLSGRCRPIAVAKKGSGDRSYPNLTEFLNTPVQGTGADGLKSALGLLWDRRAECPSAVPVLIVHDEIVLEVPEADAETAKAWLVLCMTDGVAPLIAPVPVVVDASIVPTWGGAA